MCEVLIADNGKFLQIPGVYVTGKETQTQDSVSFQESDTDYKAITSDILLLFAIMKRRSIIGLKVSLTS
uniref:Uncharacterized protein n=1 Tax=Rhizophagus irregularis (strain DAOM 181602 / DAOM 197198 / MUCL 43194) TaxID=747089 RepID=U9TKJ6_RHIID